MTNQILRPFLLDDPEQAWQVVQGAVDIFLVELSGGARSPVTRLSQGKAFSGVLPISAAGLLASPLPGTILKSLRGERLIGGITQDWLTELVCAATGNALPTVQATLVPEQETTAGAEPLAARPAASRFLWIQQLQGKSLVLGEAECVLDEGDWLQLTSNFWIEIQPGGRIYAQASAPIRSPFRTDAGLQHLGQFVLRALLNRRAAKLQERSSRIQARGQNDAAILTHSLSRLGADTEVNEDESPIQVSFADPLWTALQELGRVLGFQLRSPVGLEQIAGSESKLRAIASVSGFRVRPILLRGRWWKRSYSPLIGFLDPEGTPVALLPGGAGFELFHPHSRAKRRVDKRQARSLRASAFALYRSFPRKDLDIWSLLRFSLYGSRGDATAVLLLGVASGVLGMVTPIVTGVVYDSIIPGSRRPELLALVLLSFAAAVAAALLSLTRGFALLRIESRMGADIQAAVWDRLLALPASFFRGFSSGDLAVRSLGINQIREVLTTSLTSSILSALFSLFSFGLLFYYDRRLALVATALTALLAVFTGVSSFRSAKVQQDLATVSGQLSSSVLQILNGIAKLRVAGAETRAFAIWSRLFARQQSQRLAGRRIDLASAVFQTMFPVFSSIVIFYCAGQLSRETLHPFSTGRFVAFMAALSQFFTAALLFCSALQTATSVVPAYQRARPILSATPEISTSKAQPGRLSGAIEMNQVVFRYGEAMPAVLSGVSLSVRSGQFVAIVGASGSGKSTLCRLLLGFERPQAGAIYIDGRDLAGLDLPAVRKQIGTVLQTSRLMAGDLYHNIIGDLPLSINDALEAAELAGLGEDIRAMPMGLYTMVGEGGVGLSGGQRQRVMIARAIVSRPRIILFDEATSALDNQTQSLVSNNLARLRATRIVIAHRLSTVVNADRIYFLQHGRIVEQGTFAELMQWNGLFADFALRQLNAVS